MYGPCYRQDPLLECCLADSLMQLILRRSNVHVSLPACWIMSRCARTCWSVYPQWRRILGIPVPLFFLSALNHTHVHLDID